ncbi:MAG: acyl-CoA dehydratase activase-related protein [Bacillota bacterium]|nr:acyl-CoA dehydratase activase-related protein [Bacillota bacterium]
MKKVGIPRGLSYYEFYAAWKVFFEELGAEVVLSDRTSKKIIDDGVKACVDEACFAVKIFFGHVINLMGRADCIFIPRLTSISRNEYVCPKFGGLPDMVRGSIGGLPFIIDAEINMRKDKNGGLKAAYEAGSFFTTDRALIRSAYNKAVKSGYGVLPAEAAAPAGVLKNEGRLKIAVIGHGYNLYDSCLNMNLLNKIRAENAEVITLDMLDRDSIIKRSGTIPKKMFWNFGSKAVGAAFCLLDRQDIDGILYVMAFGCGVDSFVCDYVERLIRREKDLPFAVITLDEHSGEAGLNTRIEAFIDMIRWRKKNDINLPSHGQYLHHGESSAG